MFPNTVLGNRIDFFYNGQWNTVPANDVRGIGAEDGEITIGQRGQPDESSGLVVTTASFSLKNRTGKYSPRNVNSPLYGLIGLNTPCRIITDVAPVPDVFDNFGVATSNGWAVAPTGHVFTPVGGSISDYTESSTGNMIHTVLNTPHRMDLLTAVGTDFDIMVDVSVGSATIGPSGFYDFGIRVRISGNNWVQLVKRYYAGSSTVRIEYSVNGVVTVGPEVVADGNRLHFKTLGDRMLVKNWVVGNPVPSTWLEMGVTVPVLAPGSMSLTTNMGPLNTTPLPERLSFDNLRVTPGVVLMVGEVAEWPKRWDKTGRDSWTNVLVTGITRRLLQGDIPAGSPFNRALRRVTGLRGYWSMEGMQGTEMDNPNILSDMADGDALSLVDSNNPLSRQEVNFAGNTTLKGSNALPTFKLSVGTAAYTAYDDGATVQTTPVTTNFSWCFWQYVPMAADQQDVEASTTILFETVNGQYTQWTCTVKQRDILGTKTINIGVFADNGATFTTNFNVSYKDEWRFFRFSIDRPGGGQMRLRTYVDEVLANTVTQASGVSAVGVPINVGQIGASVDSSGIELSHGHFAWSAGGGASADGIGANGAALYAAGRVAYFGEVAATRLARIATEEGISLEVLSAPGELGTPMGSQTDQTIVALLEECARADDGVLFERRDSFGYTYKTRTRMYGNPSKVTLNYTNTDLSEVPEVTDDDARIVNQFTTKRSEGQGVGATVRKTTGPLSISDPYATPAGVGLYPEESTVNLATDDQLADYAGWRVHLGTWDESRWPGVSVALHRAPMIADATKRSALAFLDIADIFTIVNTPSWVGGSDVVLQMRAVKVFLSNFMWGIDYTALPAGPWIQTPTLDSPDYGRLDTTGSTLVDAVSTSASELVAYTPQTDVPYEDALWTTDIGETNFRDSRGILLRLNALSNAGGAGGERVVVPPTASRLDTFTRSGNLVGSNADSGQTWALSLGTSGLMVTNGTQAVFSPPADSTNLRATLPGPGRDQLMCTDIMFPANSAVGGFLRGNLLMRWTDANNYVAVRLTLPAGSSTAVLDVAKVVGGVVTTVSSINYPYTVANLANRRLRLKAMTLRGGVWAKVWDATQSEPDWMICVWSGLSDLVTGNDVGLSASRETGNTNSPGTVTWDNLIVVTPKVRPYASDLFGRTVANGFGTADEGGAWTTLSTGGTPAASDFNVTNPVATTTHTSTIAPRGGYLGGVSLLNCCAARTWTIPTVTSAGVFCGGLLLRGTSSTSYIRCDVQVVPGGAITVTVTSASGSTLATSSTGKRFTFGQRWRTRAAAYGSRIMVKVWDTAGPEPLTWDVSVTDPATPIAGWVGFLNERGTGNTNANMVMSTYDFTVDNPQRITVSRSDNGVQKAWPAGTDVRLYNTPILGR